MTDADTAKMNFGCGGNANLKTWKDIWSADRSGRRIREILTVQVLVERLAREYQAARARIHCG